MKRLIITVQLFIMMLGAATNVQAQYYEGSKYSGVGIPFFEVVLHRQFADDLTRNRLRIMAQFLYDDLTFVKSDTSGYESEFEFLIGIYDENDDVILSRTINRNVHVNDYEKTNSREDKYILTNNVVVEAGKYQILLKATDLNTNKTAQRKVKVNVPNYSEKPLIVGDILFLKDVVKDSAGKIVDYTPSMGNNFSTRKGRFYIYFDLYSQNVPRNTEIQYKLENQESGVELDSLIERRVEDNITRHFFKIQKGRFKKSQYELTVKVKADGYETERKESFSFYWSDVPTSIADIDLALRQMMYILNPDSADKYEDASLEKKQAFFKRFWKKRDPDPSTEKNELKDEYFRRVNYANRHYSSFNQDGWLTDRGRILIKFGFPDDIERHPFELGTRPYEIWRYYALKKTFLFEDRTGFGDYRLHPAYLDVEFQ